MGYGTDWQGRTGKGRWLLRFICSPALQAGFGETQPDLVETRWRGPTPARRDSGPACAGAITRLVVH